MMNGMEPRRRTSFRRNTLSAKAFGRSLKGRPAPVVATAALAQRRLEGLQALSGGARDQDPESLEALADASQSSASGVCSTHRLLLRATMGFTQAELALVDEIGYYRYLGFQLNHEAIDDSFLEDILGQVFPTINLEPVELFLNYQEDLQTPVLELILATVLRSLYSPKQLFERMVIFWTDHFNIDIFSDFGPYLKSTDDREVIRRHALGKFPDLLEASAKSAAMLTYLTNDSNNKDHPNENYARELMELHTLGADNGYTQEDVREVARCFTGWTMSVGDDGGIPGRFHFLPSLHDFGAKTVLGQHIPSGGGIEDGERVLEILAGHPNTARFVATKLIRYFLTYDPPNHWVNLVAQVYLDTGGDIKAMLREILKRRWIDRASPKLKRPYHLAISTARTISADIDNLLFFASGLFSMGHVPFTWSPPNGFPDSEGYWSGYLLPRWNFATTLLDIEEAGFSFQQPLLKPNLSPAQLMRRIDWLLFNKSLPANARRGIGRFLEEGPTNQIRIRQALGLAFSLPQFQEY
ncbi:MAG: DUF1800 domain-containing protein [Deltaproteobacteria bacterium]|nr:DUF1800 domain-containing protein [Deltaproteobacteria bacterium]